MKKYKTTLLILILLILTISVPSTLSYFFTYTEATGTVTVELFDDSSIEECVPESLPVKEITITATENSDPIFVRVKVFSAPDVGVTSNDTIWVYDSSDEYWYFPKPIDGVASSDMFDISAYMELNLDFKNITDMEVGDNRHVVVVYEGTPALFSETLPQGLKEYEYWTQKDGDTVVGYWYANWANSFTPETVAVSGEGE